MIRKSCRTSSFAELALVQRLDQPELRGEPLRRRTTGRDRLQMGPHDNGERVLALFQGRLVASVVEQLGAAERQGGVGSPASVAVAGRPPARALVAEHCQADYLPIIAAVDGNIVVEHAPGKVFLIRTLHLDVDQQPAVAAVVEPDLHVGHLFADAGPVNDLLEFLVQRLVAARPVDVGVDVGEEEGEERGPIAVQRGLPGRVEVVALGGAAPGHACNDKQCPGRCPCCKVGATDIAASAPARV